MTLRLYEIADTSFLRDPELRNRAAQTPFGGHSVLYALRDGAEEVGFLVLDEGGGELEFYSLWISRQLRGRGHGRNALALVLERALEQGYSSIVLRPVPLDDDWDEKRLRSFYCLAGYTEDPEDPSLMRLSFEDDAP
jgi:ribosomal protein S18 acetylase RimI-like enzyme